VSYRKGGLRKENAVIAKGERILARSTACGRERPEKENNPTKKLSKKRGKDHRPLYLDAGECIPN